MRHLPHWRTNIMHFTFDVREGLQKPFRKWFNISFVTSEGKISSFYDHHNFIQFPKSSIKLDFALTKKLQFLFIGLILALNVSKEALCLIVSLVGNAGSAMPPKQLLLAAPGRSPTFVYFPFGIPHALEYYKHWEERKLLEQHSPSWTVEHTVTTKKCIPCSPWECSRHIFRHLCIFKKTWILITLWRLKRVFELLLNFLTLPVKTLLTINTNNAFFDIEAWMNYFINNRYNLH